MAGSTISGKVTNTVTLGSASYPSPLTVTGIGNVTISFYSGTGIYGPASSGTLINDGTVTGGVGSIASNFFGGTGGTGVRLLSGTTGTNSGTITGGAGGYSTQDAGAGGVGVYLAAGADFTNLATITGGAGGDANGHLASQGLGGDGVRVDGGTLSNSGAITGGYSHGANDYAGAGVDLVAGTLTNTGTISGGYSHSELGFGRNGLGSGVYLTPGATLFNNGTIIGGRNPEEGGSGIFVRTSVTLDNPGVVIGGVGYLLAGFGIDMEGGGSLDNTGTILGGAGGGFAGGGVGVYFGNGGTLTNAATIIGGHGVVGPLFGTGAGGSGVALVRGGVLINTAFISGGIATKANGAMGGDGADLTLGTLTNDVGATITGGASYGVRGSSYGGGAGADLVAGTGTNAGIITGGSGVGLLPSGYGASGGTGVTLTASTTVTHGVTLITGATFTNTGSIGGGLAGYDPLGGHGGTGVAMGSSSSSTLVNSGLITGGDGDGVAPGGTNFLAGGVVAGGAGVSVAAGDTLISTGTIIGGTGIYIGAGGAFNGQLNTTISGGDGATVATGGTVLNTGTIISGVGVYLADGGTLATAGTVSGGIYGGVTADAVLFAMSGALVVAPGAAFVGAVVGNASAADTLYMANYGPSPGTLSGIGTQFTNFSDIAVGANASWVLTGANTIEAGVTLTGLGGAVLTDTGTLMNDGAIVLDPSTLTVAGLIGTGTSTIEAGSTLDVQGTITPGETLIFGGSGAYLHLGAPDSVAGSITNFAIGETIDLAGVNPASVSYSLGRLTFSGGGNIPLALANGGTVVASASADGADVTVVVCFCANTLILTPSGERPVQELSPGDLVTTQRGEHRPIVWVGAGKTLATRGRRSAATPVIVRKGALADNVPHQDLRVTKAHAFWFNGVLIPVEFLINHRLIEWDDRAQEVELYHIELASHDVLVANGAPAESYRDDGNRWLFQNARTGCDLPPLPPCAPVLTGGPIVDAIWRHLLERTGPRQGFALTDDPDLHLIVDGDRLDAGERRGAAYIFRLPARPASVRVGSRAAAPAELGVARDPRVLGVAMRQIVLRQGTRFRVVASADGRLAEGFYPFEQANGLRWTDGDAALPVALFDGFNGPMELVLHVGGATRYPLLGAADWHAAA